MTQTLNLDNNNNVNSSVLNVTAIVEQAVQSTLQKMNRLEGDTILCTDFTCLWFDYKEPSVSQSTQERNEILYRCNIKPFFEGKTLTEITAYNLQCFLTKTAETHKPSTMKKIKSIIGQILKYAYVQGYINKNPIDFVSVSHGDEDHKRPLSMDEIKALLKASHTHRLWIAPVILLCTGMRKSELLALTWNDVDFSNGTISITKAYVKTPKGNNNILHGTKTKKSQRTIPIDDRLLYLLQEYHELHGQNRRYIIGQLKHDKMVAPRVFDRLIQQWSHKAGIGHISSHYFRHTFATMAYESRQQTLTIARHLGHASTRMVEEIYIHHTNNDELRQCATVIGVKILETTHTRKMHK